MRGLKLNSFERLRVSQRGDTIVEVLIAITVASTVLTGAYLATNHNVNSTQDAQERNQAIKLVQSQIEQLHAVGTPGANSCFSNGAPASGAPCTVDATGTPSVTAQPQYQLKITPNGSFYKIQAQWDDTYGKTSNVTMYYGLGS